MERLTFPTLLLKQEEGDESLLSCSMVQRYGIAGDMAFTAISFPGVPLKPAGDAMSEPGMSQVNCSPEVGSTVGEGGTDRHKHGSLLCQRLPQVILGTSLSPH